MVGSLSGHLALRAEARAGGATVLAGQSFRVPYHVGKAYPDPATGVLLVQVANPTAGILAGDRLESEIAVGPGAKLLVTTPSASRVFRMRSGEACCRQRFAVEADGWLEMAPEPLVPHRHSSYTQHTTLAVAAGAGLYWVDQLMPGRTGHGEAWEWDRLLLNLDVHVAGTLVLRERLDQSGASLRGLAEAAGTGPHSCFANAVLVLPAGIEPAAAPAWRDSLHALQAEDRWIGATELVPGVWSLRWIAADSVGLRDLGARVRAVLGAVVPALRCSLRKL